MEIPSETFATPEQISDYVRQHNHLFETSDITRIQAPRYYLFEPVSGTTSSYVALMHKVTEFYFVFTFVLEKSPGQTNFFKLGEQNKKNLPKNIFLERFGPLNYTIKYIGLGRIINWIEANARATAEERAREEARTREEAQAREREIRRPLGSHALVELGGQVGPVGLPGFVGGHMLDYIRRDQIHPYEGGSGLLSTRPGPSAAAAAAAVARDPQIQTEEVKEDESYVDNVTCKICYTNKVNMVYIPCGHCFCSDCDKKKTNSLCPLCRKPVRSSQTFFI